MTNIAEERIDILFDLAESEALAHNHDRARRYVGLARKIGMRYNVCIPSSLNFRYCRRCHAYLLPGSTSRTRIRRGRIVRYCRNCGRYRRTPLIRGSGIDMDKNTKKSRNMKR
jgi:ribonuclease P protein subunit RPR2